MWLLPLGVFIQVCVLFSLLCVLIPRNGRELTEVCVQDRIEGAERCILIIGQQLRPEEGRARAKVNFRPNLFQWNGLMAIFAGTPGHEVLNQYYPNIDSVLTRVDNVVYIGPESISTLLNNAKNIQAFTYPDENSNLKKNFNKNDEYVVETFHYILSMSHFNETLKRSMTGKTAFVLYFSSVALTSVKNSAGSEETYNAEKTFKRYVTSIASATSQRFRDDLTVYLAVPDWRLFSPKDAEVQVWGKGVSEGYKGQINLEDLCPLISSLFGIGIPLASVGRLPEDFMLASENAVEKGLACNALQLYQTAYIHENNDNFSKIEGLLKNTSEENLRFQSRRIIDMSARKLRNISGAFDVFTFTLVSCTLIGWGGVIFTQIMIQIDGEVLPSRMVRIILLLSFVGIVTTINLVILCTASFVSYRYVLFYHLPLIPLFILIMRCKVILNWFKRRTYLLGLLYIPLVLALVEILVWSLKGGFWCAVTLSAVSLLPMLPQFHRTPYIYILLWYITCFAVIVFLFLLPRVMSEKHSLEMVNISGTLLMCLGGGTFLFLKGKLNAIIGVILIISLVAATMLSAVAVIFSSLNLGVNVTSWCLLTTFLLPLFGVNNFLERILHTCLAFSTPLIMMTRKLEPVCYLILSLFVFLWVFLESSFIEKMPIQVHYIRRGFLLFLSSILGYLLMGQLNYYDFYDKTILAAFSPTFSIGLYFILIILKYTLAFSTIFMIYYSVVKLRFYSDISFLYTYLIGEIVCLRYLCQLFFFGGDTSNEIFNHIFINIFVILILFSYTLGLFYSAPMGKSKELSEEETPNQ